MPLPRSPWNTENARTPNPAHKNTCLQRSDPNTFRPFPNTSPSTALLSSKLTPLPQHLAPLVNRKDAKRAHHHEAREQTDAAVDAELLEHGVRDEDGGEGEHAAREAVGREDGGRVARVDVWDVEQDGLEDEVNACRESSQLSGSALQAGHGMTRVASKTRRCERTDVDAREAHCGRHPMRVLCARGPRVDEEADGHERACDDAGQEMIFELAEGATVEGGEDAVLEVEPVDYEGGAAGGEDGEEDEGGRGGAEAEVGGVDDWDGLGSVKKS